MRPLTDPVNCPNAKVKGSSPTIGAQRQVRKESFHTTTGRDGMIAEKETGNDRQVTERDVDRQGQTETARDNTMYADYERTHVFKET